MVKELGGRFFTYENHPVLPQYWLSWSLQPATLTRPPLCPCTMATHFGLENSVALFKTQPHTPSLQHGSLLLFKQN